VEVIVADAAIAEAWMRPLAMAGRRKRTTPADGEAAIDAAAE
jgi:hypothetical protein